MLLRTLLHTYQIKFPKMSAQRTLLNLSFKPPIRQLNEGNYSEWLVDIRALLRKQKLWKYTQEQAPATLTRAALAKWIEASTETADVINPTISDPVEQRLTPDKQTILCLSMSLPEHLQYVTKIYAITPEMTAVKVIAMLLKEERKGEKPKDPEEEIVFANAAVKNGGSGGMISKSAG